MALRLKWIARDVHVVIVAVIAAAQLMVPVPVASAEPPRVPIVTSTENMSVKLNGTVPSGTSTRPSFSPTGQSIVFASTATSLQGNNLPTGARQIYLRSLRSRKMQLISTTPVGARGTGSSNSPSFSPDTKSIVFSSTSKNLSGAKTNTSQIVMKNRITNSVAAVSLNQQGVLGNGNSYTPTFVSNESVLFVSDSPNFTNGQCVSQCKYNVYIKNVKTQILLLVSSDINGKISNDNNVEPVITSDLSYVFFSSSATNLIKYQDTTLRRPQIFAKDLTTGEVKIISTNKNNIVANGYAAGPKISPDGSSVAFVSDATNLTADDIPTGTTQIYMKSFSTGKVTLLSKNAAHEASNRYVGYPSFSGDGKYILFASTANNLVKTNSTQFIPFLYLLNLSTGEIEIVGVDPGVAEFAPDVSGFVYEKRIKHIWEIYYSKFATAK